MLLDNKAGRRTTSTGTAECGRRKYRLKRERRARRLWSFRNARSFEDRRKSAKIKNVLHLKFTKNKNKNFAYFNPESKEASESFKSESFCPNSEFCEANKPENLF